MAEAYDAARRLLERCPELTAVFAVSDVMAMGAIRAMRDMGKRVDLVEGLPPALDAAQQHVHAALGHVLGVLVDSGQPGHQVVGNGDAVEAHHRDVTSLRKSPGSVLTSPRSSAATASCTRPC